MTAIPAVWALYSLILVLLAVCVLLGAFFATLWFVVYLVIRFILKPLWLVVSGQTYGNY